MNTNYEPYLRSNEWWFSDFRGRTHGPFVSEEQCATRADFVRLRDEETQEGE